MSTPDKAIPDKVMSDAKCIAVVTFDGENCGRLRWQSWQGSSTCRTEHGWSAPLPSRLLGELGFAARGQAVDLRDDRYQ